MTWLRALLFNIWFFGATTVLAITGFGVRAFARHRAPAFARFYIRTVLAGLGPICGIRIVVTGLEYLPREGAALIASQHQSAFDTLVWLTLVPAASYVVKQELTRIPGFGAMLVPAGMIPVDRQGGAAALRSLLQAATDAAAAGRQIIIFPEGTRVTPGRIVPLQPGIAAIAHRLRLPVIPVATDSGRCWGKRAFTKHAGTIHIALGAPIAAGTGRDALLAAIRAHWRAAEANAYGVVDKSVGEPARERVKRRNLGGQAV